MTELATQQIIEVNHDDEPWLLPEPHEIEWETAKDVYRRGEELEQAAWFLQGYAASCVEITYGEGSLQQFVYELGTTTYSTLLQRRRVYKRLLSLDDSDRSQFLEGVRVGMLSYTHLLTANGLDDDNYTKVLRKAHDENWSKRRTAEEVAALKSSKASYKADQPDVPAQPGVEVEAQTCPHCGQPMPETP